MYLQNIFSFSILAAISPEHLLQQQTSDETNLLAHLAGKGPYVESIGFGIPADKISCNLKPDKVFVFARHGERYPTENAAAELKKLYTKLKENPNVDYDSLMETPFAFIQDWKFFISNEDQVGQLTTRGKFSGINNLYNFGKKVRTTYDHLFFSVDQPFFAAGSSRCVQSAIEFSKGFFHGDEKSWKAYAKMVTIPEKAEMGADSLTVGKSCKYLPPFEPSDYVGEFLEEEADRLNYIAPDFNLSAYDVVSAAAYCAFELNALGESKVCELLELPAFLDAEYSIDAEMWHNYAMSLLSFTLGSVYVDAMMRVFEEDLDESFYFSFTHDHDLLYFMNALGIFDYQESPLLYKRIAFNRWFRTARFVPMGARVVIERYTKKSEKLIRVLVNDSVIPLPQCQSGPSYMCKLSKLREMLELRRKKENFVERCHLDADVPHALSFYRDWHDRVGL